MERQIRESNTAVVNALSVTSTAFAEFYDIIHAGLGDVESWIESMPVSVGILNLIRYRENTIPRQKGRGFTVTGIDFVR